MSSAAAALVAAAAVGAGSSVPVVPWLDQRPVRAAAHPALVAPCRAGALRAHLFLQGATGSLVGGLELSNAGAAPCSLLGRPHVSFTGAAAAATRWRVLLIAASPEPPDVLADPPGSLRALRPGKSASLSLEWSNWCGPGSHAAGSPGTAPTGLRIELAGGTSLVVPLARAPRCDAPQDPSRLAVAPFTPAVRRLPESSRLPLAAVILGPRPVVVKPRLHAFRVRRGQFLHYRVAVTNTGSTAFRFAARDCPTYVEQLTGSPPEAYVLNCRPVGTIAPHARVLFEMEIPVAAHTRPGANGLSWELAPRTYLPPFATAAAWVVP